MSVSCRRWPEVRGLLAIRRVVVVSASWLELRPVKTVRSVVMLAGILVAVAAGGVVLHLA